MTDNRKFGSFPQMETLGERIARRRNEMGLSQRDLAEAVDMSQQGIASIERGESKNPGKLFEIAQALEVSADWLRGSGEVTYPPHKEKKQTPHSQESFLDYPLLDRDLPVLGAAKGGQKGVFVSNGEIFEYVPRPGSLVRVPNAYAVYMVGDCMEDRYYAGEILFVHPAKPVRQGNFVCVQTLGEDGEREYLVKQFVRQDAKRVRLREFKPEMREFDIPVAQLIAIHRIVGSCEES